MEIPCIVNTSNPDIGTVVLYEEGELFNIPYYRYIPLDLAVMYASHSPTIKECHAVLHELVTVGETKLIFYEGSDSGLITEVLYP